MKTVFLCLLLAVGFCNSQLLAQAEEIAEINSETLQDNWLQQLYKELDAGNKLTSAQLRLRLQQTGYSSLLSLQTNQIGLKLNSNLYLEQNRHILGSITLTRETLQSGLNQLQLGNLNPAWGCGLVFKQNSTADRLINLKAAPHPLQYSPLGVSGVVTFRNFSAMGLASYQIRSATLATGKITKIYNNRQKDLSSVEEAIAATGLEFHPNNLTLGLLLYQQSYNKDFGNSSYNRRLQATTFSAKLKSKIALLGAETGISEGKLALRLKADIQLPGLSQSFGFSYTEAEQFPAYASRPSILSSYGQRHELAWDMDYEPAKQLTLGFRQALSRPNHKVQSTKWLSRNTLFLQATPQSTEVLVQLTRLDKEIVAVDDSSYLFSRPVHYRFKTLIAKSINPQFQFLLQFRYYYENQLPWISNSLYWENAMLYSNKKFSLKGGIQTWQGLRAITLPDETSASPEGSYQVSSDGGKFYLNVALHYKVLRFKTELQKAWNSRQHSIYVSLGY